MLVEMVVLVVVVVLLLHRQHSQLELALQIKVLLVEPALLPTPERGVAVVELDRLDRLATQTTAGVETGLLARLLAQPSLVAVVVELALT
jgi:hypothetical protein